MSTVITLTRTTRGVREVRNGSPEALLELSNASARAIEGVDLTIAPHEVVALIGGSASGKSTLGRVAAGLLAMSSGVRRWRGEDITHLRSPAARAAQPRMHMISQEPNAALNPCLRVGDIVGEAAVARHLINRRQQVEYVGLQLNRVGVDPMLMRRFPHELTAGQRARVGIARALAVQPEFLVCDAFVAALDVSVQAQLLNLFTDLRATLELTYLFISRDVAVVEYMSDRVMVMHVGRVVETGPTLEVFSTPAHPYTRALLAQRRSVHAAKRTFMAMPAEVPSPISTHGCRFKSSCPHAMPVCREMVPPLVETAPGRQSACHLDNQSGS